MLGSLDW